jgi:hypothetical protein
MNDLPLQDILGTNAVELGFDNRVFLGRLVGELRRVQRGSNQETTLLGIFQGGGGLLGVGAGGEHQGE